jgi:hypothetical protein
VTRKRNGEGTFFYENPFFQYQGNWDQGVKNGQGKLLMRDGGFYEGEFKDGEMTGVGKLVWPDGASYDGQFFEGEKHGRGHWISATGDQYDGDWCLNWMNGQGRYTKNDGEVITGGFKNNKPQGQCVVESAQGWKYTGNMVMGKKTGQGRYENSVTLESFEGEFLDDLYNGEGLFQNDKNGIIYEGVFAKNEMTLVPNYVARFIPVPEAPEEEEGVEEIDSKGKKPSKAEKKKEGDDEEEDHSLVFDCNQQIPTDNLVDEEGNKIEPEEVLELKTVSFQCEICFQGEEFEDPDGWTEEELKEFRATYEKDVKKRKKGDPEPPTFEEQLSPKLKTPPPLQVTQESGRLFEISLVKKVPVEGQLDEEGNPVLKTLFFRVDFREQLAEARVRRKEIIAKREQDRIDREKEENDAEYRRMQRKKRRQNKSVEEEVVQAKVDEIDVDDLLKLYEDEDEIHEKAVWKAQEDAKKEGSELTPEEIAEAVPPVKRSLDVRSHQGMIFVEGLEWPVNFPGGEYFFQVKDVTEGIENLKTIELPMAITGVEEDI